jgi:hypothetical protein
MSIAAMDEAMLALQTEANQTKGIALTLTTTGGGFLARVNQGNMYVRTVPHTERTFSFERLWTNIHRGDLMGAFRDNYTQRDVMLALRERFRKFNAAGIRTQIRNIIGFNIGGGSFDVDLALRGPELDKLVEYGEALKVRARDIGGLVDMDTTLQLDKPELRVVIDRARAADLRVIGTATAKSRVSVSIDLQPRVGTLSELNVIGCTVDEALTRAERFLDESLLTDQRVVRLIHGYGTGQLKRALAGFLQQHPLVARFATAPPEQGGGGVTVVELKE